MNPIPGVLPALNSIAKAPKIKPVINPFEEKDQFRSTGRSARARAALFLTVVINLSHRKFRYVYAVECVVECRVCSCIRSCTQALIFAS